MSDRKIGIYIKDPDKEPDIDTLTTMAFTGLGKSYSCVDCGAIVIVSDKKAKKLKKTKKPKVRCKSCKKVRRARHKRKRLGNY